MAGEKLIFSAGAPSDQRGRIGLYDSLQGRSMIVAADGQPPCIDANPCTSCPQDLGENADIIVVTFAGVQQCPGWMPCGAGCPDVPFAHGTCVYNTSFNGAYQLFRTEDPCRWRRVLPKYMQLTCPMGYYSYHGDDGTPTLDSVLCDGDCAFDLLIEVWRFGPNWNVVATVGVDIPAQNYDSFTCPGCYSGALSDPPPPDDRSPFCHYEGWDALGAHGAEFFRAINVQRSQCFAFANPIPNGNNALWCSSAGWASGCRPSLFFGGTARIELPEP